MTTFTAFRSIRLQKGLSLEERRNLRHYYARASVGGTQHYLNTETADFARAERRAVSWFRRLRDDRVENEGAGSIAAAYELYVARLKQEGKRTTIATAEDKWSLLHPHLRGLDLQDITTKWLRQLITRRQHAAKAQGRALARSTLHKDLIVLRGILAAALEEGWIDDIPAFPSLGKHQHNPRPWLEPHEWKHLQKVAKARIKEPNQNPRSKRQREELYDFCLFLVHTCCRVDEARRVTVGDCTIKSNPKNPEREYLELRIHGKTGLRKSVGWSGAVTAFRRQVQRRNLVTADTLFAEHHRDGFRELLTAAGLRTDAEGRLRNLKSLRCTALAFRILQNPRINLTLLARQAGTSVQMLDQFYLKPLSVDVAIEELL